MKIPADLQTIWSASHFTGDDVRSYAGSVLEADARQGVLLLGLLSLGLLLTGTALCVGLDLGRAHALTFALLAGLSLHIALSTRAATGVRALYLLAMALLVISGAALVLLAHRSGSFGSPLLAAVALLFMVVPIVPWGLREALTVTALIHFVFTASTAGSPRPFDAADRWSLQFLMIGAGSIALALVVRSVLTRKREIVARFELERSHRQAELLALQDPLTGCWNRRYLVAHFEERVAALIAGGEDGCLLAVLDIDRFKPINDTLGHARGDRLLQCVAQAYGSVLDADERLVRMGGDEFALLLRSGGASARLARAAAALQCCCSDTVGRRPTVSVGTLRMACGSVPPTLDEAYARADQALYAAKRAGGDRVVDTSQLLAAEGTARECPSVAYGAVREAPAVADGAAPMEASA